MKDHKLRKEVEEYTYFLFLGLICAIISILLILISYFLYNIIGGLI